MSEFKSTPGPWKRLLKAAGDAMDKLAAEFSNVTSGQWADDDAMQIFENLFSASEDVNDSGVDTDAIPQLLAACRAWDEGFTDGEQFTPEQFRVWVNERRRMAREAIAAATTVPEVS